MYEALEFILVGVVAAMGIFMAVCPQRAVKPEEKDNEKSVAGTRKKGIVIAVAAVVCAVVLAVPQFMM